MSFWYGKLLCSYNEFGKKGAAYFHTNATVDQTVSFCGESSPIISGEFHVIQTEICWFPIYGYFFWGSIGDPHKYRWFLWKTDTSNWGWYIRIVVDCQEKWLISYIYPTSHPTKMGLRPILSSNCWDPKGTIPIAVRTYPAAAKSFSDNRTDSMKRADHSFAVPQGILWVVAVYPKEWWIATGPCLPPCQAHSRWELTKAWRSCGTIPPFECGHLIEKMVWTCHMFQQIQTHC